MEENFLGNLFSHQYDREIKQILLSMFCLLTFIVLFYFYRVSIKNARVKKHNASGLLFLSLSFLSFFILGIVEAIFKNPNLSILLYGIINIFLLLSVPFFSKGVTTFDKVATHVVWYFIAGEIALIYGLSIFFPQKFGIDIVISCLTLGVFGSFMLWDFFRKQLRFIGIIAGLPILVMAVLQIMAEANSLGGKYEYINITILYPALFLSMIVLVITFNWVNEIRFKELANIYTDGVDKEMIEKFLNGQITDRDLKDDWKLEINNNQLETVIEEMIIIAEKRNESLQLLLSLASRNSRNNNSHFVNGTINQEDYNRERNHITAGLIHLLENL